ncbi:TPA: Tn3 family transposase, partial [Enterobacter roggenkampii]
VFAVPAYGPQNDVTLKMPAFEWVHVQLHQQKGMISLSPPTICNSAAAGSLKLGTIHASELIRSLLKSSRPSGLAQAIMEVGRVNKTLYLLNYIDDEDYRRRILTQLNRGEGRHAVARAICYGQRGEIRKRYREGQEDQLGALGLVTNAVVLWNTLYMQEALSWMRRNGEETGGEDIVRLSPLMHGHINMLGHYTFTLPEDILKGELRELNFNLNNELPS